MSVNLNIEHAPASNIPECSICCKPVKTPIQLKCGHVFDYFCISKWWRKLPEGVELQTCPLDRKLFSFQDMRDAIYQLPEGIEFRKLMKNYDHFHDISVENKLEREAEKENEKNRQAAYARVDAFVEAHPEFMDFLPLCWF